VTGQRRASNRRNTNFKAVFIQRARRRNACETGPQKKSASLDSHQAKPAGSLAASCLSMLETRLLQHVRTDRDFTRGHRRQKPPAGCGATNLEGRSRVTPHGRRCMKATVGCFQKGRRVSTPTRAAGSVRVSRGDTQFVVSPQERSPEPRNRNPRITAAGARALVNPRSRRGRFRDSMPPKWGKRAGAVRVIEVSAPDSCPARRTRAPQKIKSDRAA
jgi:hypothetical protein